MWILLKISLKFVHNVRIINIPALVQIMAFRRLGDKPLAEPMMVCSLTHICVTRSQGIKWPILIILMTSRHKIPWTWLILCAFLLILGKILINEVIRSICNAWWSWLSHLGEMVSDKKIYTDSCVFIEVSHDRFIVLATIDYNCMGFFVMFSR